MMENLKYALLGSHFPSGKRQKDNSSFRTIINMEQEPKTLKNEKVDMRS